MIAVLVGCVAAIAVVGVGTAPDAGDAAIDTTAHAKSDFLHRWERWRRAPLRYTETTERRSGADHLAATVAVVQRFPDRIVHDGTDVSARVDGRQIGCSSSRDNPVSCVDNGAFDAEAQLRDELDEYSDLTDGPSATYRLTDRGDGCFRLRHLVTEFRPRWGDRTDICFDAATGAVVSETLTTGALTITTTRVVGTKPVGPADFVLPATPVASPARGS